MHLLRSDQMMCVYRDHSTSSIPDPCISLTLGHTRCGHSLVTGVLLQWMVVSRVFTLGQGVLTRRLIAAIEEDLRHSRLGYEAFFKCKFAAQTGLSLRE